MPQHEEVCSAVDFVHLTASEMLGYLSTGLQRASCSRSHQEKLNLHNDHTRQGTRDAHSPLTECSIKAVEQICLLEKNQDLCAVDNWWLLTRNQSTFPHTLGLSSLQRGVESFRTNGKVLVTLRNIRHGLQPVAQIWWCSHCQGPPCLEERWWGRCVCGGGEVDWGKLNLQEAEDTFFSQGKGFIFMYLKS